MRTTGLGLIAVAVVVVAIMVLSGGSSSETAPVGTAEAGGLPPVEQVVERVEELRGLEFKSRPKIRLVSGKSLNGTLKRVDAETARRARTAGKAARERAQALEAASVLVTTMTGIVDPERDPELIGDGDEGGKGERGNDVGVAGLYVPERDTVYVVRELAERDPEEAEAVLAHELVHALEDQHFDGFERNAKPFADSSVALRAVHEGSATLAEVQYRQRHQDAGGPADAVIERIIERQTTDPEAPPGVNVLQSFPYVAGGKFAADLHRESGWPTVNRAHEDPPRSTAAVLHPEAWPNADGTQRPRFSVGDALGPEWARLGRADLGEVDTLAILRAGLSEEDAARAADGWRAGRFEAWADEGITRDCKPPCRPHTAAVLVWRYSSDDEASELVDGLKASVAKATRGEEGDDDTLRLRGGAAATLQRGRIVVLAFAPTDELAKQLAESTPRPS